MAVREILLLGNPLLYEKCETCMESETADLKRIVSDLHDTLFDFRKKHGFGRAIAAPQIDERKRIIYMYINQPMIFLNPVVTPVGSETITLWDDCMSFPGLLVKVKRYKKCKVEYLDLDWQKHEVEFHDDLSELIQHENDHLDGILAIQRAIDAQSFALSSQRDKLKV